MITQQPIKPARTNTARSEGADGLSRPSTRMSRIASRLSRKKTKEALQPDMIPVSNLDEGIVGWDSQEDPKMPLNFPDSRKWMLLSLLASVNLG